MQKRFSLCLFIFLLCSGCANNFSQFYRPHAIVPNDIITCISPEVRGLPQYQPIKEIVKDMYVDGYTLIGESSWHGGAESTMDSSFTHGQSIGACVVMGSIEYSHTRTGVHAYTDRTPAETYIAEDGRMTVITPSHTTTEHIPYSVAMYAYGYLFFAKTVNHPELLMAKVDYPPDYYMKHEDVNYGCLVDVVMRNGNAYMARIFADDIIMSINGEKCNPTLIKTLLRANNEIVIWRDGEILTKNVELKGITGD